jgi:hypothetical protein
VSSSGPLSLDVPTAQDAPTVRPAARWSLDPLRRRSASPALGAPPSWRPGDPVVRPLGGPAPRSFNVKVTGQLYRYRYR